MKNKHRKTIIFISFGVVSALLWLLLTGAQTAEELNLTEKRLLQIYTIGLSQCQKPHKRNVDKLASFHKSEFYRVIIDNNLFRPLGWHPPRQKEIYRLLGTILPTDENTSPQAILRSTTGETHIIGIGDTLDPDTIITNIQPKQVTLEKAGQKPRILTLNPILLTK